MPGLEKLLRGVVKYRKELRPQMLRQFEAIRDKPEPQALVFSCVDSRVLTTRLLQTDVGDMFLVRNAGNLVPHAKLITHNCVSTEPGVMELACLINNVRNVIVCGHSDCKAMNTLHALGDQVPMDSPLKQWLQRHGAASLTKYEQIEVHGSQRPLEFEAGFRTFQAYIDPDNRFNMPDKLSQVNTLQQLHNIASYPFMAPLIKEGKVQLHAMWFDIYTGDFYIYSGTQKSFVLITEQILDQLLQEY